MRILIPFFLLTSCGYHWQSIPSLQDRPTFVCSYVDGDTDGTFTAELVRAISSSGVAQVTAQEGEYRLVVSLGCAQTETVGYRFDRQKVSGELKKNIVGCEGRRTLSAKVTLYRSTDEIAFGPLEVFADADYDYIDGDSLRDLVFVNSNGVPTTVLPFSLGQLEPVEAAQEAAGRPLNARLARKIVDALLSDWNQSTPTR